MHDMNTLHHCYLRAFEGEAGKAVLADIESRAYVRDTSFNPDPQRAAFNEGRRSMALHIRRMLDGEVMPRHQQGEEAPGIS
ncbi:Bbp19 family protein [Humidesulfovibrio idahonensis]